MTARVCALFRLINILVSRSPPSSVVFSCMFNGINLQDSFLGSTLFFYFFHFYFSSSIPVIIYILPPIRRTNFNNSFDALFNSPCFMYIVQFCTQIRRRLYRVQNSFILFYRKIYICRLLHREWKRQRDTFYQTQTVSLLAVSWIYVLHFRQLYSVFIDRKISVLRSVLL